MCVHMCVCVCCVCVQVCMCVRVVYFLSFERSELDGK
jgi:hypothetical protein